MATRKIRIVRIKQKELICEDPKTCSTRKHVGGGHFLCSHHNLAALFPDIAKEWDYDKNDKRPEEYTRSSGKKVSWKCSNDPCGCHVWNAAINTRTGKYKSGCPFCFKGKICKHYNLLSLYPEIAAEWNYEKNNKGPEEYTPGSDNKVFWRCSNVDACECHVWAATIGDRVHKNSGCPFCKNFSNRPCKHNNLKISHPEIAKEWNYDLNNDIPENYPSKSNQKVFWKCSKNICGCHIWRSVINSRTLNNRGCPFCNSNRVCIHNNLKSEYPEIASEWDYELNEDFPENYSKSSHTTVKWRCQKGHRWDATINTRTNQDTKCPVCRPSGYSRKQIEWLNNIMEKENIHIQHAENGGEFYIQGIGKVDGYCQETNTVYEFHGSYWHGNCERLDFLGYHPKIDKKNIEIFIGTLLRDRKIQEAGYNLVNIWEHRYIPSK